MPPYQAPFLPLLGLPDGPLHRTQAPESAVPLRLQALLQAGTCRQIALHFFSLLVLPGFSFAAGPFPDFVTHRTDQKLGAYRLF